VLILAYHVFATHCYVPVPDVKLSGMSVLNFHNKAPYCNSAAVEDLRQDTT